MSRMNPYREFSNDPIPKIHTEEPEQPSTEEPQTEEQRLTEYFLKAEKILDSIINSVVEVDRRLRDLEKADVMRRLR